MARLRTAGRVLFLLLFGGAVLLFGAAWVLTRTRVGQDLVLREALDRVAGAINGELTVGVVRSRQILLGGTFVDVVIADASGRPFLVADSIAISYSVPALLAGNFRLTRVDAYRPRVTLERLPGQESFNLSRIFVGEEEPPPTVPPDSAAAGQAEAAPGGTGSTRVVFRRVSLHDGSVDVVYPVGPGPEPDRGLVESLPGVEGRVRRLTFRDVDGRLDEMRLADPAFPGPLFVVDSLSLVGTVLDDPFVLRRFTGTVRWEEEGIAIEAPRLLLPGTEASATGTVTLGEDGPRAVVDMDAPVMSLADARWVVPSLPEDGVGSGHLTLDLQPGILSVSFRDTEVRLGESQVSGKGTVVAGNTLMLDGVDVQLEPLAIARIQPYLPDSLPIRGLLRGRVRAAGPLTGPWVSAQVTLDQSARGRGPTVVDATGIVHLDGSPGVTDFDATLEPAQLDLFTDLVPQLRLRGLGSIRVEASGRLEDGIRFTADVTHRPVDLPRSHVHASGTVRSVDEETVLDVEATLDPLSFTAWRAYAPDFPVTGEVRGTTRVEGPLSELRVVSDLETVAGSLGLDAVFDGRDPLASYRVNGELEEFRISELVPGLPDPSTVTGSFRAEGSGADPAVARGSGDVSLWRSHLGSLVVDTAAASLRVADGFLHIDTLTARTSVMELGGAGALALDDSVGVGRLDAQFRTESLEGIRPYILGDSLIARDTLSTLELEGLRLQGIDPDTLPLASEIAVEGSAEGRFTVTGSMKRFDLAGDATLHALRVADSRAAAGTLQFGATGLPGADRTLSMAFAADSLEVLGRSFLAGRVEAERSPTGGRVVAELQRSSNEVYNARATFELDSATTVVNLDELTLRFDDRRWNLSGPARLTWGDALLDVEHFRMRAPVGGLDLAVDGRIARGQESDLTVRAERVPLDRVAHVLQLAAGEYTGLLDATVQVAGTLDVPRITGTVLGREVGYGTILMDRVEGSMSYADRVVETRWNATRGERTLLHAEGTVPVDLSWGADDRVPNEPVDLDIVVDSLPAALVMGLLDSFEDVEGTVTGRLQVAGTVTAPSPSGSLHLVDGAAVIPALGVRHQNVVADFQLSPDGTVEIDGRLTSGGMMSVVGSVVLDTLSNPYLDLRTSGSGFLATDRADVLATVGGDLTVEGRYRRPLVRGQIQVESGALYLSEIQRTAEVVDLTDPLFLDVVDTTLIASQPILAAGENPFLRNLRLDVEMSLDRNFWLRSREMNVEMEGDLEVFWDRTNRDLAMLGELQAVRGTYSRFGRQFQVQQGTVRFIGTPGLDPDLNILAVNRLRVRDGEPLNIFALLEGTLLRPRVTLSSDAQPPIASSELVSYLIFGRPTYELASAEFSLVQGEFGGLVGTAAEAGASLAFGALGTQLGSAVAQEFGLDYFAISQAQGSAAFGTGFESALRATQVEVGWYVAQDVFLALLLRPLMGINSGVSGARLEWRATDLWTVEGYLEDRFARELNTGFSINEGFEVPKVWGLFLAREWGY